MPKISIIMPVYNTKKEFFIEAIDSVLSQTYIDFEILIIDDGSTIDYSDVLSSYDDLRIKYFKLSRNVRVANARNFAIKKAKGEFIAFLDSDDIALPERLSIQLKFLEENPHVDCVGSSFIILPEGKIRNHPTKHIDIIKFLLFIGCPLLQSSVMLRKNTLIKNNIFYKDVFVPCEDYALWLDLIGVSTFANTNDILVKYRLHGNNISIQKADLQKKAGDEAKIRKILFLAGVADYNSYHALQNYICHPQNFGINDLTIIEKLVPHITQKMIEIGLNEKDIVYFFRKNYTKLIRKAPSKTIVRKLCFSPLNSYLNVGLHRQLFYYIIKGIFLQNHI